MRAFASRPPHGVLLAGIVALLAGGCSYGRIASSAIVGPDQMGEVLKVDDAFKDRTKCFQYGRRPAEQTASAAGGEKQLSPSLLPGDRLSLDIFSAGTQDYNYKNAFPPMVRSIDVAIRQVAVGGRLDIAEQQALATFLQVNRNAAWIQSPNSQGEGISFNERRELAKVLKASEAALWNAFVATSCVKAARSSEKNMPPVPVLVVQFDIRALCRVLPEGNAVGDPRQRFARAFLVDDNLDQTYLKGCDANLDRQPMTVVGLRGEVALGNWASTALGANAVAGDPYYADDLALASPKFVQGHVAFESVAPFRPDPPAWSLTEWEQSGICTDQERRAMVIKGLRLRGSGQTYYIVDDEQVATHEIEVTNRRRTLVVKKKNQWWEWSLPVGALSDLTAADVDELLWAPERRKHSPTALPPGCVARQEG